MNDLPKVYASKLKENISNNRNISFGKLEEYKKEDIYTKVNRLFKESTGKKLNCIVKINGLEKKIVLIGKTNNNLITYNEEMIPISDITDIYPA